MTDKRFQILQNKYYQKSLDFDRKLLKIPLKESGKKLIFLPDLYKKHEVKIAYRAKKNAFLRKSVAIALVDAAKYFNGKGVTLKVESAYRSLNVQKDMFVSRYKAIKKMYPNKSKDELLKQANTYTAGIPILAAHTGGAAVDVILLNKNGVALNFGVPYPHGDIESVTNYPHLSKKVKENRKLLKEGMEKFGFTNYPFEYWHYSMGDACATYLEGRKAVKFGPVNYDFDKNKILRLKTNIELRKYFSV